MPDQKPLPTPPPWDIPLEEVCMALPLPPWEPPPPPPEFELCRTTDTVWRRKVSSLRVSLQDAFSARL